MFEAAVVTGGASGIGAAVAEKLEAEGTDVRVLDLVNGFDVGTRRPGRPSRERTSPSSTPAWAATAETWRATVE